MTASAPPTPSIDVQTVRNDGVQRRMRGHSDRSGPAAPLHPYCPARQQPLKRATTIWLLALAGSIALATTAVIFTSTGFFGAQKPVRDYLEALRDGDGPRALGFTGGRLPDASAALLDGEALKTATAKMENVRIEATEGTDSRKLRILVRFTVNGTDHTSPFLVEPVTTQWLFFTSWRLLPTTLPVLNVAVVNSPVAQINDKLVSTPGGTGSFAVFFPGVYSAWLESSFFWAPATDVTVESSSSTPSLAAVTEASPQLLSRVNEQLKSFLDQCTQQKVLMPSGCPMGWSSPHRVTSDIVWSIVRYPQAEVSPFQGKWTISPLTVRAKVTYQEKNNRTGEIKTVNEEKDFPFDADLTINTDAVTVVPIIPT